MSMWLKRFKYTCDDKCFFLVWNFAQMWKIIMKREYFVLFFLRKKSFNQDNFWTLGTLAHQEKPRKNNNSFPYSPVLTGLVPKLTYCTLECFTDCRSRARIRRPAFDRSLGMHFGSPSQSSRNPCVNPASWGGESRFGKLRTRSWW
jgi:hypothetical protein